MECQMQNLAETLRTTLLYLDHRGAPMTYGCLKVCSMWEVSTISVERRPLFEPGMTADNMQGFWSA